MCDKMGVTLANTPYEEVLVHSNMFSVTASPDVSVLQTWINKKDEDTRNPIQKE